MTLIMFSKIDLINQLVVLLGYMTIIRDSDSPTGKTKFSDVMNRNLVDGEEPNYVFVAE